MHLKFYKMKKIIFLLFVLCAFVSCSNGQLTFSVFNYTEPTGFTKEIGKGNIAYTITDKKKGSYCKITLLGAVNSNGDIQTEFEKEWKINVTNSFTVIDKMQLGNVEKVNGWDAITGMQNFTFNKNTAAAIQTTFVGFGKTAGILIFMNDANYQKYATGFLEKFSLNKPTAEQVNEPIKNNSNTNTNNTTITQNTNSNTGSFSNKNFIPKLSKGYTLNSSGTNGEISFPQINRNGDIDYTPLHSTKIHIAEVLDAEADLRQQFIKLYKQYFTPKGATWSIMNDDARLMIASTEQGYTFITNQAMDLLFGDHTYVKLTEQGYDANGLYGACMALIKIGNKVLVITMYTPPITSYQSVIKNYLNDCDFINTWDKMLHNSTISNFNKNMVTDVDPDDLIGAWDSRVSAGLYTDIVASKIQFSANGTYNGLKTFEGKTDAGTYTIDKNFINFKSNKGSTSKMQFWMEFRYNGLKVAGYATIFLKDEKGDISRLTCYTK
jgi:hypothetical protein